MVLGRYFAALVLLLVLMGTGPAAWVMADGGHEKDGGKQAAGHKDGKAKGDEKDHSKESGGHGEGNPIFPWALDLGIWTLAVFILLLFILRKYAWGPMLQGLQKREDTIRLAVEEAKIARGETERVRQEFKAEMDRAYAEIPKLMAQAREDAERLKGEMVSKANSEIQTERQRLRREIDTVRDSALQQIWDQAANLATMISAKVIHRSLTAEDQERLMNEALNEVRKGRERGETAMHKAGEDWHRQGGGQN